MKTRCAVYTRKSHEEGLEQEFNSLDAQREAGEAYIAAQKHEGWTLISDLYDDGGYSGGNIERPALKRLMADIEAGKIDVVVVYKIDRMTRSLLDFSKLIGVFEKHKVSFVAVTQQFNTTTSMGRLVLNVLLSFAQFEREVTGERIRDKLAASKKKGMWMGGVPPYGYESKDRKLCIKGPETIIVREIFDLFIKTHSATVVAATAQERGYKTRAGRMMDKGYIYRVLTNPAYIGQIVHKDQRYEGKHEAIIPQQVWDTAQAIFKTNPRSRGNNARRKTPALLRGLIKCAGCNSGMTPTGTNRNGRDYRYYTPSAHMMKSCATCPIGNISAGEIEGIVLKELQRVTNLGETWDQLFPAAQAQAVRDLVDEVIVRPDGVEVALKRQALSQYNIQGAG